MADETPTLQPMGREWLLAQAKLTQSLLPVEQRYAVYKLVREGFWLRACSQAEILDAAYRDPKGHQYWDLWLSEPLDIHQFAEMLALHNAGTDVLFLDGYLSQIFERLRAAAEAGETWFIGDVSLLLTEQWAALTLHNSALTVRPREAIAWMCQNPNARHLVPPAAARIVGALASAHIVSESDTGRRGGDAGAPSSRPLTEKSAQKFAQHYFAQEKQAGREPTQSGLEKAAIAAGMLGGREYLRTQFHKLQLMAGKLVKRGPPKKFAR